MTERAFVVGVGMTKFEKPGARTWDYPDMAREATQLALSDADIGYEHVEQAFAGFCQGETTSGQRALAEVGRTGIPIFNVNNACATGSSALYLARNAVRSGAADCVLALGFEKMQRGSIRPRYEDQVSPLGLHVDAMAKRRGLTKSPMTAQMFANAALAYMERYEIAPEALAEVAVKNHRHSVKNPYAQFQDEVTLDEVMNSPVVAFPLTKLQCCPTSDGSAAAVVASERFVIEHELGSRAVEIAGQGVATEFENTFDGSDENLVGYDVSQAAARRAYDESGLGVADVQVIELHDCFSSNEVLTYEALGLCREGKGANLARSGATTYGGPWVVNPSGGLISKGHPLGATGLAQCAELVWQLRGTAGPRQVDGAEAALQHNLGLVGTCVVTMYRRHA